MTERPLLFSAPMVRALLAGTKTQTRRAMRVQPPQHTVAVGRWQDPPGYDAAWWAFVREGKAEKDHPFGGAEIHGEPWRCPFGKPGERLWVRETWQHGRAFLATEGTCGVDRGRYYYRASDEQPGYFAGHPWRPAIHMPRAASRIQLEVTGVRVERLQVISDDDARAEGIELERVQQYADKGSTKPAMRTYADLWAEINGHEGPTSWAANPWVWVVSFNVVPAA